MPIYQKALGDTVRKARRKANLSQAELAEMLDIGLRTPFSKRTAPAALLMFYATCRDSCRDNETVSSASRLHISESAEPGRVPESSGFKHKNRARRRSSFCGAPFLML